LALRFLNDEDAAADATQISFISAYQNIKSFHGGSFRAWLLRIVTNNCYDELRRQKRKPTQSLDGFDPVSDEELDDPFWMKDEAGLPEDQLAQKELERVIQRCIQALPEDFRATAHSTRVPVGTVRSRLARARQRLQECLQGAWELLPEKYRLKDEGSA
jgi:RNA polymerase sigma-70 factor (ECF subfamily)